MPQLLPFHRLDIKSGPCSFDNKGAHPPVPFVPINRGENQRDIGNLPVGNPMFYPIDHKGIRFFDCRRQTNQIQIEPTDQCVSIRFR